VTDFPTTDGRRLSLRISANGRAVTLTLSGQKPPGPVFFEVPSFVHNIASSSAGSIDQSRGTVVLSSRTERVTVQLRRAPAR
jgi:hypothetical protein